MLFKMDFMYLSSGFTTAAFSSFSAGFKTKFISLKLPTLTGFSEVS